MNKLVVGSVLQPDWLEKWLQKRANIMGEIDRQLIAGINTPEKGLSLNQLQMVVEHKNPWGKIGPFRFLWAVPMASATNNFVVADHFDHENKDNIPFDHIADSFRMYFDNVVEDDVGRDTVKIHQLEENGVPRFSFPGRAVKLSYIWQILLSSNSGTFPLLSPDTKNFFKVEHKTLSETYIYLYYSANGWRIGQSDLLGDDFPIRKYDRIFGL